MQTQRVWIVVLTALACATTSAGAPSCTNEQSSNDPNCLNTRGPSMLQINTGSEQPLLVKEEREAERAVLAESEKARQTTLKTSVARIECSYLSAMLNFFHTQDGDGVMKRALAKEIVALARLELQQARKGSSETSAPQTLEAVSRDLWQSFYEAFCALSAGDTDEQCRADFSSLLSRLTSTGSASSMLSLPKTLARGKTTSQSGDTLQKANLAGLGRGLAALRNRGLSSSQSIRLLARLAVELDGDEPATDAPEALKDDDRTSYVTKTLDLPLRVALALGERPETALGESLQASADLLVDTEGSCSGNIANSPSTLLEAASEISKHFMQLHCGVRADCASTYATVLQESVKWNDASSSLIETVKAGSFLLLKGSVAAAMKAVGLKRFEPEVLAQRSSSSIFEISMDSVADETLAELRSEMQGPIKQMGIEKMLLSAADLLQDSQ